MPLLDSIADVLGRLARVQTPQVGEGVRDPHVRAGHPPVNILPDSAETFGPGIGNQPDPSVLMQYNVGTPAAAARAIRNRVSNLDPLVKYPEQQSEGTVELVALDDHRLKTMLDNPHPDFTRSQMLALTTETLITTGIAYLQKVSDGFGLPVELMPLPVPQMRPLIDRDRISAYEFTDGNGARLIFDREQVIRIWLPDPENIFGGRGFLGPNAISSDAARYAHEHTRSHYERNATPVGTIEHDLQATMPFAGDPASRDRFEAQWMAKYNRRGGKAQGVPPMLWPGARYIQQAMQTGADIAPLLEFFERQELLTYGTPASVLGRVVSGDRSSAETNQYVFDQHTILPIAQAISDALTRQLARDFDESLVVEFEDFVMRDKEFELKAEQHDLTSKLRTINEVRKGRDGLDEVEWGDLPVGTLGEEPYTGEQTERMPFEPFASDDEMPDEIAADLEEVDEPEEVRIRYAQQTVFFERLYGATFAHRVRSIFTKQRNATVSRFRAGQPRGRAISDDIFDSEEWAREFAAQLFPIYRQVLERAGGDVLSKLIGTDVVPFIFTSEVEAQIRREGAALVTQTGATTKRMITRELETGVGEGESERQLVQRLNRVFDQRKRDTKRIARTEVGKAVSLATMEGARQSGVVTHKKWLHSGRMGDPRDPHVELGKRPPIPLNEPFEWIGEDNRTHRAQMPRAPGLPAGEVINCQCDISFPRIKKADT